MRTTLQMKNLVTRHFSTHRYVGGDELNHVLMTIDELARSLEETSLRCRDVWAGQTSPPFSDCFEDDQLYDEEGPCDADLFEEMGVDWEEILDRRMG